MNRAELNRLTVPKLKEYAQLNFITLPKSGTGSGARGTIVKSDLVDAIVKSKIAVRKDSPKKIPQRVKPVPPGSLKKPQRIIKITSPGSLKKIPEPTPKKIRPSSPSLRSSGTFVAAPTPRKISPKAPEDVYFLVYDFTQTIIYFISLDKLEKLFKKLTPDLVYYGRVLSVNCRVKDVFTSSSGDRLAPDRYKKYDVIFSPGRNEFHSVYFQQAGEQRIEIPRIRSIILDIASKQPLNI